MKVFDLQADQEKLYFLCLEDWSDEMDAAGPHKQEWYRKMQPCGLRVKVVTDDEGEVGGMIQYGPIENLPLQGSNLYYVYCIWVHGYQQGRGNFQHRGMGTALLQAAEEDTRELGSDGLVVWGMALPFFMRAAWFRKHGYTAVDRDGIARLLWKPFNPEAVPPKWIKHRQKPPKITGKVSITCLKNGWCPAQNLTYERARRAAAEFGEQVIFTGIDTFDRSDAAQWGITDGLFIDGKQVAYGPPPSYEKIKRAIGKRAAKLRPSPDRP